MQLFNFFVNHLVTHFVVTSLYPAALSAMLKHILMFADEDNPLKYLTLMISQRYCEDINTNCMLLLWETELVYVYWNYFPQILL